MTPTEIRTTLTGIRDAVEVPVADRVAFQARVRAERRRRAAGRVVLGGAAAAVVVAGIAMAGLGTGDERRVDPGPADPPAAGGLSETVYFVHDGRLTALDPTGQVHDLGTHTEGVVGFTAERVFAVDDASRLVEWAVSYDEQRVASFSRVESPVPGRVLKAVLSGDGRFLAWTDTEDVSHRYDLKAGREDVTIPGAPETSVLDVSSDGLLLFSPDGLVVRDGDSEIAIPVAEQGTGVASQLAFGHVLVNEVDGSSRLYDIRDGVADPVARFDGFGVLGPYAERVAVARAGRLEVWDGRSMLSPRGLGQPVGEVRWADETTLLVGGEDATGLWACDIELACDPLPIGGEVNLNG